MIVSAGNGRVTNEPCLSGSHPRQLNVVRSSSRHLHHAPTHQPLQLAEECSGRRAFEVSAKGGADFVNSDFRQFSGLQLSH